MTNNSNKPVYGVIDYDILEVSCKTCGNWVQLSGADPRCNVENYDFCFKENAPIPLFSCRVCNSPARESYYKIITQCDYGDHELRDVTAEIRAAMHQCPAHKP